jgi:hypothetical protein
VALEETTSKETRREEGAEGSAADADEGSAEGAADNASNRWENGKLLSANAEDLRRVVMEEAQYLEKLSRRIEALVESQSRLCRRIEIYVKALGILPSIGRGIAGGFGIFLGATLVAGLFVYMLSQWEAVPFFGEFVKRILEYIQTSP